MVFFVAVVHGTENKMFGIRFMDLSLISCMLYVIHIFKYEHFLRKCVSSSDIHVKWGGGG